MISPRESLHQPSSYVPRGVAGLRSIKKELKIEKSIPSVADRNMFRRSRHLGKSQKVSLKNTPRDHTESNTRVGSKYFNSSIRLSLKPVDPIGMASHSGVSKNFMSFIDGLGIPCASDNMVLTSRAIQDGP